MQEGGGELAETEAEDIVFLYEWRIVLHQAEDLGGEGEVDPGCEEGQADQDEIDQG